MAKHYSTAQKQEALNLLAFHNDNVPIVEQLTGIPRPTLYRWRKQELSINAAQMRQKNIPSIDNHSHSPESPPPLRDFSPPPDEPEAGVPGRTYPYPLDDDESDAENNFAAFRRVREVLMDHAQRLAASLQPDDPDINRRSLALARILDRIHHLDNLLPDLIPERVVRHEFVYDGMVHNIEPWKRSEEYLLAQLDFIRDRKAQDARKSAEQGSDSD